jgi:L-alanine-DL-glutamate epimerase-like enolase superfamily enzyme
MTIRSVSAIPLTLPFNIWGPPPMLAGKPRQMEMLLVRVETDQGMVGWGEAFGFAVWPATRSAIEALIEPMAVGRDEADIDGIMSDLARKFHLLGRSGPVVYAMSGLDIALWDLAGKAAGKPVAELLGGRRRDTVRAYASLMRYGNAELAGRNSAKAVSEGFGMIKLHEITEEPVRSARAAIGPDVKLTVDANCPWSVDQAMSMARALAPEQLFWLEEPIWPPEDYAGLARVRRESPVPTAAGENASGYLDFQSMFAAGAVDYAQPSVTKIGGIGEMMRIAELARTWKVALAPHSPYVGPGLLATVHILAALEEDIPLEYCYCELDGNPLGDAVVASGGFVPVPTGPGLGRDPDPALIERRRIA